MNRILALIVVATCLGSTYAQSCGATVNGSFVNLAALTKSSGQDYSAQDPTAQTYDINICAPTLTACGSWTGSGVCQVDTHGNFHGCGTSPGVVSVSADGKQLVLNYANGGEGGRTATVYFMCAPGAGIGSPVYQSDGAGHISYSFTWASAYACAGAGPGGPGGGISGGWVFVIIYLVGFFLYCVIGVIYKWRKVGATGKEMIPNVDFWTDLPALVRDGFRFVGSKTCMRGSSGDFSSV
eukprot:TRINITY_DN5195_c0_g1_i1.p1 TRINITY_DN5195_c0_g1~~TRINITY_DN5195_c0_g1_i1.p1  ORF type:complete len:239 (-),score=32.60 TRINITY_DN5195_c0_g1_i1:81-797(-)